MMNEQQVLMLLDAVLGRPARWGLKAVEFGRSFGGRGGTPNFVNQMNANFRRFYAPEDQDAGDLPVGYSLDQWQQELSRNLRTMPPAAQIQDSLVYDSISMPELEALVASLPGAAYPLAEDFDYTALELRVAALQAFGHVPWRAAETGRFSSQNPPPSHPPSRGVLEDYAAADIRATRELYRQYPPFPPLSSRPPVESGNAKQRRKQRRQRQRRQIAVGL